MKFSATVPTINSNNHDVWCQVLTSSLAHYGSEKQAETLHEIEGIVTSDITTEWKTYRQLLVRKPKSDMKAQLKKLVSNDMLKNLFANLTKIGAICLSIPVMTALVAN